jgi:hypothetical protein
MYGGHGEVVGQKECSKTAAKFMIFQTVVWRQQYASRSTIRERNLGFFSQKV